MVRVEATRLVEYAPSPEAPFPVKTWKKGNDDTVDSPRKSLKLIIFVKSEV